ncbi:MAG: outer membrane beta-barrel protein [Blastocatellia bacterium]
MRKLFLIAAMMLALPIMAQAQDSPRTEIFGGYSYLRLDDDVNDDRDLNGWNASVNQTIFKKWLGFKADFSGAYGDFRALGPGTDLSTHLFLFGPQFTLRKSERFQPFGHVLFGAARADLDNDIIGLDVEDTAFAMAVGGGLDVKVLNRLSVRLFQADYVLTRFDDDNQHNFRASTGLVLRLGSVD